MIHSVNYIFLNNLINDIFSSVYSSNVDIVEGHENVAKIVATMTTKIMTITEILQFVSPPQDPSRETGKSNTDLVAVVTALVAVVVDVVVVVDVCYDCYYCS